MLVVFVFWIMLENMELFLERRFYVYNEKMKGDLIGRILNLFEVGSLCLISNFNVS